MKVIKEVLNGAFLLEQKIYKDKRGFFIESFNKYKFENLIKSEINFIQDNLSFSSKGVLRGLHFQKNEFAQSKLVKVVKGSAFDVAVDLRPNSNTYGEWFSIILSDKNNYQFYIPKGFAHGFLSLENNTIFQYKVDAEYSKISDSGIKWDDKELNIKWPKMNYIISKKDQCLYNFKDINFKNCW